MIYLELLWGFIKVGMFSFGGAYAAIPLIREVVLSYGWLDDNALSYMIAISESTPGPLMINVATYVGSVVAGLPGAIISTIAVIIPPFLVILIITVLLKNLLENKYVKGALEGLKPCISAIILETGFMMIIKSCFDMSSSFSANIKDIAVILLLFIIFYGTRFALKKKLSPISFIIISAFLGLLIF
ncbi:MAG: chromate transporter [Lachnospiraceae bacterium]|nr:chromate transporter [Lachnospiraceae bacterium]